MKSRVLKNRICRGVAAYYVTKDNTYKNFVIETMDACCASEEWSCPDAGFMGLHGGNLATGDLLFSMAFSIDSMWNQLTQKQQQGYLRVLSEKGLGAYLLGWQERDWWTANRYNWNPSLHGNAALAALLILNYDPEQAQKVLSLAIPALGLHIPTYLEDGGYTEGPMYQGTAIGHLSDFVIAWYNITGNDFGLSKNENFKNTLRLWNYLNAGDGGIYNFSNCSDIGSELGLAQCFWWARHAQMPEIHDQQVATLRPWQDTHGLFYDVECFWHRDAQQEAGDIDVSGLHHFKGIDWVTYKSNDFWFAFAGGLFGGGHSNAHHGHFILGKGKQRFLCDPGYGAVDSFQHNTISVSGCSMSGNTIMPIKRVEQCAHGFYICIDLQPAWATRLSHCLRHVLVLNDCDVLVFDDAQGTKRLLSDGSFEELFADVGYHWQTRCAYEIDGEKALLKGEVDQLTIEPMAPIHKIEPKDWEFDDRPITTFSYRDYANEVRSSMPCFLSFAETPCVQRESQVNGVNRRSFTIAGSDYHFDDIDGAYRFVNT